jgi:histone acetyltransferase (RNA polymerase elongator complex component)
MAEGKEANFNLGARKPSRLMSGVSIVAVMTRPLPIDGYSLHFRVFQGLI